MSELDKMYVTMRCDAREYERALANLDRTVNRTSRDLQEIFFNHRALRAEMAIADWRALPWYKRLFWWVVR